MLILHEKITYGAATDGPWTYSIATKYPSLLNDN
jgi:hypothetical protein